MDKIKKPLPMPLRYAINLAVFAVFLFGVNALITGGSVPNYYTKVIVLCGINIILAVSLNVATGYLGQLPLGHAGFMAVGAYASALFLRAVPNLPEFVAFPLGIILGGVVSGIFGILIDGIDTRGKKTWQLNQLGIARTFQNIRLFSKLSVEDNVKIGLHNACQSSLAASMLRLPSYWSAEKKAHETAMELLSIFDMQHMASWESGSLPYGAQRRLEIVRALATSPKVLLLDEPAAGMNPSETAELMQNIKKIRDTFHLAILLIEHDMNLVMGICEGIAVLNYGKIIAKGTPDEIKSNPLVIEAYLGRGKEAKNA